MKPLVLASCFVLAAISNAAAQVIDEDLDQTFVTIATGAKQTPSLAPATTTVITAADIRAMGASDLNQVLETVPGVHVSYSTQLNTPIYSIRGIHTNFNPEVLMLLNGNPLTTLFLGNRGLALGGLALHNVARIEVIRGSGSALYGADAFSGVINIITKTASEINGTQFGTGIGDYQTHEIWALHGKKWNDWELAAYFRAGETNGAGRLVQADLQTSLDSIFNTRVSRAPGPVNDNYRSLDAALDLSNTNWRWRGNYTRRNDVGSGAGVGPTLDPDGSTSFERITSELSYRTAELARDWDITLQMNYFQLKEKSFIFLFPVGSFGGVFPNGVIGAPDKSEQHLGFNAGGFYTGFNKHRIRLGFGIENYNLYRTRERKNFDIGSTGLIPLPSVIEASDEKIFLLPRSRQLRYFLIQDEWQFAPDFTLTSGVRHDRFSDFGTTTNPRLALVWKAQFNLSAKLLFGRAFRAPSFTEQYSINNPTNIGNPQVQPERISTIETGINWQPQPNLQLNFNLFRYQIRDILRFVPNPDATATAQNAGSQRGQGFELETNWLIKPNFRLSGNYAYQRSINETTDKNAGLAPTHHGFLRGAWQIQPMWALDSQLNVIAGRKRQPGDTRPEIANYRTVDFTLRHGNDFSRWNATLSVRNAFNDDVREPSINNGAIPFDLPLAGRNIYFQLSYKL